MPDTLQEQVRAAFGDVACESDYQRAVLVLLRMIALNTQTIAKATQQEEMQSPGAGPHN